MDSIDFLKSGSVIVTDDGILAEFSYAYKDEYGQKVFKSPLANNIGDHICHDSTFRVKGWRMATEDEKQRLIDLNEKGVSDKPSPRQNTSSTRKWKIEGYAGWNDYDGPSDNNIHKELEIDSFFTEDDIYAALQNHFKDCRTTVFTATRLN